MGEHGDTSVKVVCRFRPFNTREKNLGIEASDGLIKLTQKDVEVKDPNGRDGEMIKFKLYRTFGMESTQEEVYEVVAANAMIELFKGYNSSIFAYGQTGSGKTWTMFGDKANLAMRGLIPRCTESIFKTIMSGAVKGKEFTIACSYCEIYQEKITDLFRPANNDLQLREDPVRGVFVDKLSTEYVSSVVDVYQLLALGEASKKKCATKMNQNSSRSHCCFTVRLQTTDDNGKTAEAALNLIDLAGSERISKTGATGQSLEEAKKINLSLTALAQVINCLADESGKAHVPYRQSKLTRLLQNSLGGNSKTSMVVNCSPHIDNVEETLSSLRFAQSCARVQNKVKQNYVLNASELQAMLDAAQAEIQRASGGVVRAEMKNEYAQTQEGEEQEEWNFDDSVGRLRAEKDAEVRAIEARIKEEADKLGMVEAKLENKQIEASSQTARLLARLDAAMQRASYAEQKAAKVDELDNSKLELEKQLIDKDKQISLLQKQIIAKESEISDLKQSMVDLNSQVDDAKAVNRSNSLRASIRHQVDDAMAQAAREFQAAQGEVGSDEVRIEVPDVPAASRKPSSFGAVAAKAALGWKNKALQAKVDKSSEKLAAALEEKAELEVEVEDRKAEIGILQKEALGYEQRIKDKEQLIDLTERAKISLEKRIESQDKMIALIEKSKADVEKQMQEQQKFLSKLQESEKQQEKERKGFQFDRDQWEEDKLALEKRIADLEAQLLDRDNPSKKIKVPLNQNSVLQENKAAAALNDVLGGMGGLLSFGWGGGGSSEGAEEGGGMLGALNPFSARSSEKDDGEQPKGRPVSLKFW